MRRSSGAASFVVRQQLVGQRCGMRQCGPSGEADRSFAVVAADHVAQKPRSRLPVLIAALGPQVRQLGDEVVQLVKGDLDGRVL